MEIDHEIDWFCLNLCSLKFDGKLFKLQGSPEILALKQRQDELISLLDHLINETSSHQSSSILNESNEVIMFLITVFK